MLGQQEDGRTLLGFIGTDAFEDATDEGVDAVVNQESLNQELLLVRGLLLEQQAKIDEQGRQIEAMVREKRDA